jgi:methionyl-tRNA formyltransferase
VRILYLGLPLGAVMLVRAGHTPAICAIGHHDAPGLSRLRRRLPRETLLLGRPNLDDPSVADVIASAHCDVLLSWFWPRRIPASLLKRMARGAFGVHPSLLPRFRGPDPYFHAIDQGEQTTGVTLHRLEEDYDTGAIVAQIPVPIGPEDTGWTLARRLDRPSLRLLVGCAEMLAGGLDLAGLLQDESKATHAPRPTDEDLALRFPTEDAIALERRVRAAAPAPGATALLEDNFVTVERARLWNGTFPSALAPGEAFLAPEGMVVRARQGGLLLERVRLEEEDVVLEGHEIATLFQR